MKVVIYILLIITFMGCNNPHDYDSCLQALEVVSVTEFNNGEVEYEVIIIPNKILNRKGETYYKDRPLLYFEIKFKYKYYLPIIKTA